MIKKKFDWVAYINDNFRPKESLSIFLHIWIAGSERILAQVFRSDRVLSRSDPRFMFEIGECVVTKNEKTY